MKMKSLVPATFATLLLAFTTYAPGIWDLDPAHSQLRFSVSLFGLSDIEGSFKIKEATISAAKDDFSDANVSLVADVNTIDTDNDDRDKHLRTADFFDAAKYPDITFKSTSFKKTGDDKYKVTGDLSFHGITKQVTLDAIAKQGIHPVTNKNLTGFRVSGVIKRLDFGISAASPTTMLADEVYIHANLQFIKK